MRRLLLLLLALATVISVIVLALYVYKFGDLPFSSQSSDWGQFGDYVGGTLGTWFAFLAFVGVLGTVWLQYRQLEDAAVRTRLEELQRLINSVSSRADTILDSPPSMPIGHFAINLTNLPQYPLSVFNVIAIGGTVALADASRQTADNRAEKIAQAASSVQREVNLVVIELTQLVWCLEKYASAGGADDIAEFYKRRYRAVVCWIDSLGLLSGGPDVERYFEPKKIRAHLDASIC
jgi:hypothetical protein